MRHILPAILLLATACSAPRPMTSAAVEKESTVGSKTLLVHEETVELGDKPTTVALPLADARATALEIARDPKRALALRVEGIGVTAQPGIIYDVIVGDTPVGVLSFYGAEEQNGSFVAVFTIDAAVRNERELRVTFKPRGVTDAKGREVIELQGRARFARLRLVEE